MAHYAYLDDNNIVVAVTVGKDETELIDGLDTETYYAQGTEYTVKRTSYNAATNGFRYNYAGIGYKYDEVADAFIAPKPECGHPELELSEQYQWHCDNAEHIIIRSE
jgi:hypothetical protein